MNTINENTGNMERNRIPRLRGVIAFRFTVSALFLLPLIALVLALAGAIRTDSASGPMVLAMGVFCGIPFSLPSLVIAIGIMARRRWAGHLAIISDFLLAPALLAVAVTGLVPYFAIGAFPTLSTPYMLFFTFLFGNTGPHPPIYHIMASEATMMLLPVAFLLEGVFLIRLLRMSTSGRVAYASVAVLMFSFGVAPALMESAQLRPVISYCNAHWFAVPAHARISIQSRPFYGRAEVSVSAPDGTYIVIYGKRLGNNKWLIESNRGIQGMSGVSAGSSYSQSHPPHSQGEAIKLVRSLGAGDQGMLAMGSIKVYGGTRTAWRFKSPRAQGTYVVPEGHGGVFLDLNDSTELP